MRWIRRCIRVLVWALLGAIAGRIVGDIRTRGRDGREPTLDLASAAIRPPDVVPGLVAALRIREWPWSVLHIPAWFAAFAVNFALAAFGPELAPLRRLLGGFSGFSGFGGFSGFSGFEEGGHADGEAPDTLTGDGWTPAPGGTAADVAPGG